MYKVGLLETPCEYAMYHLLNWRCEKLNCTTTLAFKAFGLYVVNLPSPFLGLTSRVASTVEVLKFAGMRYSQRSLDMMR